MGKETGQQDLGGSVGRRSLQGSLVPHLHQGILQWEETWGSSCLPDTIKCRRPTSQDTHHITLTEALSHVVQ